MKGKILQILLVTWVVLVLATHWVLRGGPGLKSAGAKFALLRTAQEILSSWFYAPYGQ